MTRGRRNTTAWTLAILIVVVFGNEQTAAEVSSENMIFRQSRVWKTKTGASFKAAVVDIQKDVATFKREDGGGESILPVGNLIRADEAMLRVAFFGEQDKAQMDGSRSLLSQIDKQSHEAIDALKKSHLDYPDSPYGGLWASVCLGAGANKTNEAASVLRQVIARIDRQREFDSSRHPMTWASSLNNLAVCMIKSHKSDAAAGLLSQSLGIMPSRSPIILRNASQLLAMGDNKASPLELTASSRQRLEHALSNHSTDNATNPTAATVGWRYSLDVDLPRLSIGVEPLPGLDPPRPGL